MAVEAPVRFGTDPAFSFGDTFGQSVPGVGLDGGVNIAAPLFSDGFESGDTTTWSSTTP